MVRKAGVNMEKAGVKMGRETGVSLGRPWEAGVVTGKAGSPLIVCSES